jgi:hypothetical protein
LRWDWKAATVAEEELSVREVGGGVGGDEIGQDEKAGPSAWVGWRRVDGRVGWKSRADELAVAAAEDEKYNNRSISRVAGSQALVFGPGCCGGEDCERIDEWVPGEHRDAENRVGRL